MRRFSVALIVTASIAACAHSASAADLTAKAPVYKVPYNWTGFYVGGHLGAAWSTTDFTGNIFAGPVFLLAESLSHDSSSWIAGGQAGYLYQFNSNWVAGFEVSWSGVDLHQSSSSIVPDRSRDSKIKDLLLVTGRLGYASDKWLAYIKGGYANASIDLTSSVTSTGQLTSTSSGRDDGWTVGGGFDYAIYGNFSVGIEYNFARISIADRNQFVFPGFGGPGTVTDAHADIHAVVARLNYRIAAP